MASAYPAMKGKFGSTEYFVVTMKAGEVADKLTIPTEMPGWEKLKLEERFQREINYNRVKKQIVPYLSDDPDRFFGALIVNVCNDEEMEFESASTMMSGIPKPYQTAAKSFGFLTLSGSERLIPLDGQHRLAALQAAISGKDEKQQKIPEITSNSELAKDDIMLIMIRHDPQKGRKIFNKVNRYAKATTKSENLITADDDVIAIISREIVVNKLIGDDLVNYQSNTLSDKAPHFTTLSTIYEATKHVLEDWFGKIDISTLPEKKSTIASYKNTAKEYWEKLLGGVNAYKVAIADKSNEGGEKRAEMRRNSLLGKPISQLALMLAVIRLRNMEAGDGSKLSWNTILDRINRVNWANDNPMWEQILMSGSRIVAGKTNAQFASRFIAYHLGESLTEPVLEKLREDYASRFSGKRPPKKLPNRLRGVGKKKVAKKKVGKKKIGKKKVARKK